MYYRISLCSHDFHILHVSQSMSGIKAPVGVCVFVCVYIKTLLIMEGARGGRTDKSTDCPDK